MTGAATPAEGVFLGLKAYELLTLAGVFMGPLIAVAITLWAEQRRRVREGRVRVLTMLLNTRGTAGDPAFSIAINMIPVEFKGEVEVINAWREYIEAVRYEPSVENASRQGVLVAAKQTALIYRVAKSLGFGLTEADIQTEGYLARGLVQRDNLYLDSLVALRDLADSSARAADAAVELLRKPPRPPKER